MANSTEEDYNETSMLYYLCLFSCPGIILVGLVIQSFMVAVNGMDWLKGRSVTGTDKIISSIGISRIFFHTSCLMFFFSWSSLFEITEIFAILIVSILQVSALSNLWLSTLLSIFFYFKISIFRNVFFLYVKAIILTKVVQLIIASMLFTVVDLVMNFFATSFSFLGNSTQNYIINEKQTELISYVSLFWTALPLLLFFIASLLLIILLGLHMSRMNNHGSMTSSTDTYQRTMMFTVVSFLACTFNIIVYVFQAYVGLLIYAWFFVIMNILQVLHSVLLIYVTAKLRNQFFRIVHCGMNCFLIRKSPGLHSKNGVEVTAL
ncbi:taste receptor type 2 member 13-like [Mantella aurantiaca]